MDDRAFVFSGTAFLLVIPALILAVSFTTMLDIGTTGVITHLRGDKVFVLFEVTEKDLGRAGAISGRRAAVAALDYIATWNETLDSYSSAYGTGTCGALREMILAGTLTGAAKPYDPSSLMQNNTLPEWIALINDTVNGLGFDIDIGAPTVGDVGCECFNETFFYVRLSFTGSVSDETGNFVYNGTFPRSGNATTLVSAEGTTTELFPDCGNLIPVAVISSPSNGSTYVQGTPITFVGNQSNDPDGDYPLNFTWSSNLDGVLSTTNVTTISTLSVGIHTITLTVTDSRGGSGSSSITVTINPNSPPVCNISAPLDGSTYLTNDTITFVGNTSYDPDGDSITYQWDSNIDGNLSTSDVFSTNLSAGSHTITLTCQDTYGNSDQDFITLIVNAPPGANVYIYVEAENGAITAPMAIYNDPARCNGQYVRTPPIAGCNWDSSPPWTCGYDDFTVNLPTADTYVLWGLVDGQGGSDDSFWISVDMGAESRWNLPWSWNWRVPAFNSGLTDPNDPGAYTYALSAGVHTFRVRTREDNSRLDRVLITNDFSFTPSGCT